MADVWLDIFVGGFVLIALAFITVNAWIMVFKTESIKIFGPSDPNEPPSVLPYLAAAIFISVISLIIVAYVHNLTTINLQLPPPK